ncbi:hypothetical protein CsatA_019955 [Cannabis sativa]
MSSIRGSSYSVEEDVHLCHVYVDISQDPIVGRNQSGNNFWARVQSEYHKDGKFSNKPRPVRSLQTRMSTINSAVAKLRGCINQIENKNPSGASAEDILIQAKMLLAQDKKYDKGFKFDHVWHILKGIQKFSNDENINAPRRFQHEGPSFTSSKSSSHNFESPTSASTGMSSFDLNMNNEEMNTYPTERPCGVKKAKEKQLGNDQFNKLMEQNKELIKVIEKSNKDRNERHRRKADEKILFTDLNSISDPEFHKYIQSEKRRIYKERAQTFEVGEQGEGSQYEGSQYQGYPNQGSQYQGSQYEGSQYRASQDSGHGVEDEDQRSQDQGERAENDSQVYSPYYDYLGGSRNNLPHY